MASIREFWCHFGQERFTKADLWKAFGGRQFPGFPTDEFISELVSPTFVVPALGPRGGEGWRLSPEAINDCIKKETAENRRRARLDRLVADTAVAYGTLKHCQNTQRITWQLKLPFAFSNQPENRWTMQYDVLSFQIDLRNRSYKRIETIVKQQCDQIATIVDDMLEKEQAELDRKLTMLGSWIPSTGTVQKK